MNDNLIAVADIVLLMHECRCRRVFKTLDKTMYMYVERGQSYHT